MHRDWTLGVDVGGVIVAIVPGGEDTSFFGGRYLETPAVDGVFEALAALTAGPFAGRVHIVSKAGPKVAGHTREWMEHHRFFERTGINPAHLHFVRERRDKAPVCRRLGITHFVDDRPDVLACLETVEHRFLFRPPETPGWAGLAALLIASGDDRVPGETPGRSARLSRSARRRGSRPAR
ncbi:hypothetical protein [Actinoplanes couchii]|uniref:Uncharacterized protein n=1 Tax=Actinoplanes couchii TaxID=403638 RepID=A0ABQ3XDR6_9ACTN|nr:hypothetical protein [Actinoplanes couchii]MDR6317121.1 hypothetical protein [Actinoplanes couchii]GID56615.1 hypothetical protein Aco03nite_050190 [Actinoplanes couchii]